MTIFGLDVSEHQDGLSLQAAKSEGYDFVIIRLCDGTYRDRVFNSHLADAEAAGLVIAAYWYLRAPSEGSTLEQQIDVIDSQFNGRRDIPIFLDVESVDRAGNKTLTGTDVWNAKRSLEARGYEVAGVYTGRWYWEEMPGGEPSMKGLGALWVSNYGTNAAGYGSVIYANNGGENHAGWRYPLGDKFPDILQFGSRGIVASREVDVNAFEGSIDQLKALLKGKDTC